MVIDDFISTGPFASARRLSITTEALTPGRQVGALASQPDPRAPVGVQVTGKGTALLADADEVLGGVGPASLIN